MAASGFTVRSRYSCAARRFTLNPPGRMPSVRQPRTTHSCITVQIFMSPACSSSSVRQWRSLRRMSSAMLMP